MSNVAQDTQDKYFTMYLVLKQKAPGVDCSHIDRLFTILERFKESDVYPRYYASQLLDDILKELIILDNKN
jgi:hypothetical protein